MRTLLGLALLMAACGSPDSIEDHELGTTDSVVGDPCATSRDCVGTCYTDPERFPGGFCSLPCQSDLDCPADTVCIDREGGVCLFTCGISGAFDCTFLGPGYRCDDKDDVRDQRIWVCIAD